jgi:DNA-binding response OmpR family regulator
VGGQGQRRILVVEDDFFVSDLVVSYLSEQGYAVDLATSARALGRHLELHAPDLILLDIMLPGMDGSEIGHLLRVNPDTAGIPIIVVSADRRIARKAASIHADAWIAKPFDLEALRAKIEEVLAAQPAARPPETE